MQFIGISGILENSFKLAGPGFLPCGPYSSFYLPTEFH